MKVDDFVKKYEIASDVEGGGEQFIQQRIINTYVPFIQKVTICNRLVDSCWHIVESRDQNGNPKQKKFRINSPNTYLLFVLQLIKCYTDLEVMDNDDDFADQYDTLNKAGLLLPLMHYIPEAQYAEFKMVLDMVEDDMNRNEYYIGAWLSNKFDSIGSLLGGVLPQVMTQIDLQDQNLKPLIDALKP